MNISARNQLKGKVKELKKGPVSTEVVIDVNGSEVVSSITTASAESLNLSVGDDVVAIVKASNVMVGKE
ncbi:molybdenum-pterin-binding protein [Psychrobacter frigidicola]|uniref:Molybdenum-pterin-binding protein n=1 Tax=Psychrobacter frigidicola TaxID=45611 RepID=A0A5C7A3G3_9GAMM|nr:TOBE domain-containing protein [Psychrobacter frigidicola]TXD97941.1 molybdenum-pterin-binding protein [Psychrobacter frigidicola]